MKQEWRYFLLAVGFFTRVPVPSLPDFHESELNRSVKYFTLIGILVGGFSALIFSIAAKYLPMEIAVLLSMIASIYLTGCFHEDGLADAADGLGGGWDKEQVLTIMTDSRIGSYGSAALILGLLTKFEALAHMPTAQVPLVLIAAHAFSRLAATLVIYTQEYVRSSGKAKPLATQLTKGELVFASIFGLAPLALLASHLLWALVPVAIVWLWFSGKLKQRLGGYTGDCLGAMQQLTELTFYIAVLGFIA